MKTLLILLMVLSLQADKILLSGVSFHGEDKNLDGKEVNSLNYGIGYQKEYSYDNFNTTLTFLTLKDSFNNPMVSATYGIRKGIDFKGFDISLGAEFGVAHKKVLYETVYPQTKTYEYVYTLIPIAFVPTVSIKKETFSVEVLYIPELNYNDLHVMSVALIMIGIEI